MEMHQSVLDPLHQDIFDYKLKQDNPTNIFPSNNQNLEQMTKVNHLVFNWEFFLLLHRGKQNLRFLCLLYIN